MAYLPTSLGACCASCASGGPCASSLGAASRFGAGVQQAGLARLVAEQAAAPSTAAQMQAAMSSLAVTPPSSHMLLIAGGLGLAGVAGLYLWKRRKR